MHGDQLGLSGQALFGRIEGRRMTCVINDFVLRFLDHTLCGIGPGLDTAFRAQYPEVVDVDHGHVRDWAVTRSP